MAAVALLKFTQGPNTDVAGRAVLGTLTDGSVTIENGNNTDVFTWRIYLLDAPPDSTVFPMGSQPQILAQAVSATPLHVMTAPDVPGTYRIMLEVENFGGTIDRDVRCFGVPDTRNFVRPPYQKHPDPLPILNPPVIITKQPRPEKPDEQNYGTNPVGWAGDESSGQMTTFFETYEDLPHVVIASTPYSIVGTIEHFYLVDLPTIGGNGQVVLPFNPRVGQVVRVGAKGPQNPNQILTVLAASNIGSFSLVKLLGDTSALFLHKGGNEWQILGGSHNFDERTLVGSVVSTDSTPGWTVVGGTVIDPNQFPGVNVTLEVLGQTTTGLDAAEFRLFNLTTVAVVAGSTLSWTETTPTQKSAFLSLPAGTNVYEAQIRLATTGTPNRAIMTHARLAIRWFQP